MLSILGRNPRMPRARRQHSRARGSGAAECSVVRPTRCGTGVSSVDM
jgi:hypothetical protein